MLRVLRLLLTFWVLVALQTTVVPRIGFLDARPDLPFILVILTALREGAAGGALAGFVAGLFVDLNSPGSLGVTSLLNALIGFAVGSVTDRLIRTSLMTRFAVVLAAVFARDLVLVLATAPDEFGRLIWSGIIPGALYTAVLAGPLMAVMEWAVGWGREPGRGRH